MSNENEILTIAGKRVEKRYTPSENEVDRCMKCCLHNSIECDVYLSTYAMRPCEAYHKRGGYAYFVPAEETHSLREWAQIMAERPDLRAEFDKMCPPQPIRGSIAPEADLEGEIKKMLNSDYYKRHIKPSPYVIDAINYTARHFAEWGAEHLKR